jgi:hypothetical protein
VTILLALLGVACAAALGVLFRRNALEQRAMNEAYDLWRTTGQAVPGWDRQYAWSDPVPVEPGWSEPLQTGTPRPVGSTPPLPRRRSEVAPRPVTAKSRWDEASVLRSGAVAEALR